MNEISKHLMEYWSHSGIESGDMVLIHSSIKRTLKHFKTNGLSITPLDIFHSFSEMVGSNGTLLFPLFNFQEFTEKAFFDFSNTPSQMGALTELVRNLPKSVRTGHPIYSFAVIGAKSYLFKDLDNKSAYGLDSPFSILDEHDGKIAILDLDDQHSMTFYHYVEEIKKVKYRYMKEFSGTYIDKEGNAKNKIYTMFVRDIENNVVTHVNPTGQILWDRGMYVGERPFEGNGLRSIKARDVFKVTAEIIENNQAKGLLYKDDV